MSRKLYDWCPEPESNRYAGITQATDFKSVVSTNFTTRARWGNVEMRSPEGLLRSGALYRDACRGGGNMGDCTKWLNSVFLDTLINIPIMRTSFFAGIAQLVERYLAKV